MYFEFFLKNFRQQSVYRTNTFIRVLTSFIYLFVTVSIWTALYKGKGTVDGISLKEMLTYILMVQIVQTIVRQSVSSYVADRASSGNLAIDFIRPVNLKLCAMFDSMGGALFNIIVLVVPIVIMGSLVWGFALPQQLFQWIVFIPSLFMALVLYSTVEYIMGLTAFWTKTNYHVSWIVGSFMTLFSGRYIPLWFYPKSVKLAADVLPFKYFIFEPINIFLGKVTFYQSLNILLFQFVWLVILLLGERIMWHFAQRVVTVQGG